MKIRRVRKRDGREVPFDLSKIRDAVARAEVAVGENEPEFAHEVAQIVELTLERRYASQGAEPVPGIEEIQDLVEQALIELGRATVAKAYILYRDRRARIRAALEVRGHAARPGDAAGRAPYGDFPLHNSRAAEAREARAPAFGDPARAGAGDRPRAPRVQLSDGVASWSKGRIVAALMNEADLPRASAEQVAARVEQRVFDSGFRRISTALIRELVDNELVDLGLAQALKRQRVFGLARHDLRRLIADPAHVALEDGRFDPGQRDTSLAHPGAEQAIASEILRRYALEDLMPEQVAELHLSGELSIEDITRPHLALAQAVPCDLLQSGEPGPTAAFRVLDEMADLCGSCAYGLVLDDCGALIQSLQRGRGASQGWLGQWLRALAALARTSQRHLDLCASAPTPAARGAERTHAPAWIPRFLEDLDLLSGEGQRGASPRAFMDVGELALSVHSQPKLQAVVERLLLAGRIVPTFGSAGESAVGPGLVRHARERGALTCGGAIALNLPRLARRAGPWREDLLLEELSALLQHALGALLALQALQRNDRNARRGRVSYAITPVGLREALRWIGDGELRPEQGARVLGFLTEAAQRFGQERGLSVVLSAHFGEQASARFAALDAELFSVNQPSLFESDQPAPIAGRAPYSCGFDIASADPSVESSSTAAAAAALLATQRSGTIHPASLVQALGHARGGHELPLLAALERLELSRARLRSGGHALYALPRASSAVPGSMAPGSIAPGPPASAESPSIQLFPEPGPVLRSTPPSNVPHASGTQHS